MIIVLTLGRSGSSLLMQTLDLLGCNVAGRKFDEYEDPAKARLHRDLNPGGYFEDPEIFYGGPRSKAFRDWRLQRSAIAACKMDLRRFADPAETDTWLDLEPEVSALLISFRNPSEQAYSEYLASRLPHLSPSNRKRFFFTTQVLQDYHDAYGMAANVANGPLKQLAGKLHPIDYAETRDAESYVKRICEICGLDTGKRRRRRAIDNIDPSLFRIRADGLTAEERGWASHIGAAQVFTDLISLRDRRRP